MLSDDPQSDLSIPTYLTAEYEAPKSSRIVQDPPTYILISVEVERYLYELPEVFP